MNKCTINVILGCVAFVLLQMRNCVYVAAAPAEKSYRSMPAESSNKLSTNDTKEDDCFPFIKAVSKMPVEDVAGLRIKDKELTLLGYDNTYFSEQLQEDVDFSDLEFFKQYPKLLSVELNKLNLTDSKLENLQKFLPTTLKSLVVDLCKIENRNMELLADIIEKHKQLESVKIRLFNSDAEESARILSALSGHSKMKILSLGFDELSNEGCEHLASLISNSAHTLQTLALAWGNITGNQSSYKKIVDAIHEINKLRKLDFSIMTLPEDETKIICESINKLEHLKDLKIFFGNLHLHNHIKLFESMEALRDSLKQLKALESLDISSMKLPGPIMQLIAQSISSMRNLKTLNISNNSLTSKSAEIFSESIKDIDLTTFIANGCDIDANVFSALCKSLHNSVFRYLYFRGNKIKEGAKSLPIGTMQEVMVIDFSKNDMNYDDVMEFIEQTKNHPKLHIVNFKENKGIISLNNAEKTIKNDQVVEWKIKNNSNVSFFGL